MHSRTLAAVVFAAALVIPFRAAAAPAADEATLLRVFLTDGTSLVSYGEPARVSDRVIFSMPTVDHAEPAAASGQPADRARRLGAHQPLRRDRARVPLRRDAGRNRLRRALQRRRLDAQRGRADRRAVAAAGDRPAGAPDAGRLAADPLQLPRGGSAADARHARRGDRRPAGLAHPRPLRAQPVGVHRSAGDRRAAVAAAGDPARRDRAGADGGAIRGHERGADVAAGDRGRRRSIATRPSLPADWAAATRARRAGARSPGSSASNRSYQSLTARMMAAGQLARQTGRRPRRRAGAAG